MVDGVGGQPEEVEIAGPALDVPVGDQRAAAGKSKVRCLIQAGDDLSDSLLGAGQRPTCLGPDIVQKCIVEDSNYGPRSSASSVRLAAFG